MNSLIDYFNSLVRRALEGVLLPFSSLSPLWGLLFVSVVSGVVLLICYGRLSNQSGLKATKRRIGASILEAVLYRQDLRVSLRAQKEMLWQGCRYFLFALKPILILAVPCIILLTHLHVFFGYRPLEVGGRAIVKTKVADSADLRGVTISGGSGVRISAPFRDVENGEVTWRLDAVSGDARELSLQVSPEKPLFSFPLAVRSSGYASPVADFVRGWYWGLLYPGASMLPAALGLKSVSVGYPEERYRFLGIKMHWVIVFLIVSILVGVVASKLLHIEI